MPLTHRICVAALLISCATCVAWSQQDIAEKTRLDPDFQRGKAALLERRYAEAKDYLEAAEARIGKNSAEINAGIALAETQLGNYSAARQRETVVLGLVSTDHARAEAHNVIGTAWLRDSMRHGSDLDQLHSAEQSFREALKFDPGFAAAHFNLGDVLQRLGRESDAAGAFKNFVRAAGEDPAFMRDAPVQRLRPAPDFNVADSHGASVSSASLRGRVVLLDFWATWCPPCIRALPVMRELARYFPPDQFQLISVDEDSSDQAAWRSFIAQQKMDWTQVWDRDSRMYSSFGLAKSAELSLPRYVLLDADGYVLRVYEGTDQMGVVAGQVVKTVQNLSRPAAK